MDVIFRNLERLVYSDTNEREAIEPMSEWKWKRLYDLSCQYGITPWVAEGIKRYADDFFLQLSPSLQEKLKTPSPEKNEECLARFELMLHRAAGPLNRFSKKSLQAYADDFIKTLKNIEE